MAYDLLKENLATIADPSQEKPERILMNIIGM